MISRREFLQSAAAACLLTPALSLCKPLWGSVTSSLGGLGKGLQAIFELTTLHHTWKANGRSKAGLPELTPGEGEMPTVRNALVGNTRSLAVNPRSLLLFGHVTDAHTVDEESPSRLVAAEQYLNLIGVGSAFHPQEDLTLQVANAIVRTMNEMAARAGFDFLLNTGDTLDNAQENELAWFLDVLEGKYLDTDSGNNEDPVAGPDNDANDAFRATGLNRNIPYYNAIGNHDVLFQGNIPIAMREIYNSIVKKYLSFMVLQEPTGNWSNAVILPSDKPQDLDKLKAGEMIADARRRGINGQDFIRQHVQYATSRPSFGFPKQLLGSEQGYYSFHPKSGLPIKVIVLDTTFRLGTCLGIIDKTQLDEFLIPELEKAKTDKELVIVSAHHPSAELFMPSKLEAELLKRFGKNDKVAQLIQELVREMRVSDDYVSRKGLEETLTSYPNVIAYVAGHIHSNKIIPKGENGRGYWEIVTSSLLGYPQQARVIEVVYEGNGIGAIQTSVVDHNSAPGSLAYRSRELSYQDSQGRDAAYPEAGSGQSESRNAILRFNIPPEVEKRL
jgi:hypothetical protein